MQAVKAFLKTESLGRQVKYLVINGDSFDLYALHLLSKLRPNLVSLAWSEFQLSIYQKQQNDALFMHALENGGGWKQLEDTTLGGGGMTQSLIGCCVLPSIDLSHLTPLHSQDAESNIINLTTQVAENLQHAQALTCLTLENTALEFRVWEFLHPNASNLKTLNLINV